MLKTDIIILLVVVNLYMKSIMKKTFLIPILALFLVAGTVNAQTNSLPNAGITPESTFYFLDRLGENLREFFTFNSEAKAKLQIKFAGERIAEIKAIVEKKGPEAKGIDKAKILLLGNVAYAAEIVKEEKASGKNISRFAKEIDDAFDAQEKLLVQTFQDARKKLKEDRLALKKSLSDQTGDAVFTASLEQQLNEIEIQDEKLKDAKDEIKESLRGEKEKIEEELDDEDREADEQEKLDEGEQEEVEEMEIENEFDIEDGDEKDKNDEEAENEDDEDDLGGTNDQDSDDAEDENNEEDEG